MQVRRSFIALIVLASVVVSCSSDGDDGDAQNQQTTTSAAPNVPERFAVGTVEHTYVDRSRVTPANGEVAERAERTLPTTILYPATGDADAEAPVAHAEPADETAPYPLIVFSHGLGGSLKYYEPILQEWAAAGYVVAAPEFPLTHADTPGGLNAADVQQQPGDVSFVLDQVLDASEHEGADVMSGLVDPDAIALAGHSNGAITTLGAIANSCCREGRVAAAVVLSGTTAPFADGEYDLSDTPPVLFVHGTKDQQVAYQGSVNMFNDAQGPKGLLTLDGQDHGSWFAPGDAFDTVVDATTSFLHAFLRDDSDSASRLVTFEADGVTLDWVGKEGSTVTIPTIPRSEGERSARASPTTGLTDGQLVTVTWEGFNKDGNINIVQCSGDGTTGGSAACDLTDAYILQPNPTGEGSTTIDMVIGPVGSGVCDATHPCMIVVNDSGLTDEESIIRIPVTFAG